MKLRYSQRLGEQLHTEGRRGCHTTYVCPSHNVFQSPSTSNLMIIQKKKRFKGILKALKRQN
jgi:hypothetical protein